MEGDLVALAATWDPRGWRSWYSVG